MVTSTPRRVRAGVRLGRDEQAAATRSKLLEVAIATLCDVGYGGLTAGEISARAGLTRGAVQHHFPDREALIRAVFEQLSHELITLPIASRSATVAGRIDAAVDRYWEFFRGPHYMAIVQLTLGSRGEPAIHRWITRQVELSQRGLDQQWHAAFAETGVPAERIRSARLVALASLRGFTVLRMNNDRTDWSSEIAMLKEMLLFVLTAAHE